MADYISPSIAVEPEDLLEGVYDYLQTVIPGWEPNDANLDVWLAQAFAQIGAQVAETASDVPAAIFRYFGAKLIGLPQDEDVQATIASVTITPTDTVAHFLPAGTAFDLGGYAFLTTTDLTFPAGSGAPRATAGIAVEAGSGPNGSSGAATLVEPLDWVASVTASAATDGEDAESDSDYQDRLAAELRLMTPRPILPDDFTVLARRIDGVGRALALDTYDPVAGTSGHGGYVTVAVADENGEAVSSGTKAAVGAYLESLRGTNYVVPIIDPTYTTIGVAYTVTLWPGVIAADATAAIDAALAEFLSPASWGRGITGDDPGAWNLESTVRAYDVASVILGQEGVRSLTALTLSGGTASGSDRTLSGAAPLTRPGVIAGTVA